jgi:hypothetical protein
VRDKWALDMLVGELVLSGCVDTLSVLGVKIGDDDTGLFSLDDVAFARLGYERM